MSETKANIYVVTTGTYSSYSIDSVFDNEELAKQYAKIFTDGRVETYQLNPTSPYLDKIANGYNCYRVELRTDYFYCNKVDWINEWWEKEYGFIWATSEEHAQKIAADRYAKWKYENEMEIIKPP